MKILFVSNLSSNKAAGLSWSVPAGVNAQSSIDDVLWINTSDAFIDHWAEVNAYHNSSEYGKFKLSNLPDQFTSPDIVVFEGFNFIKHAIFARSLERKNIPYIIVPRGALTYEAQNNHSKWKKKLANIFFLNRFVKKSLAIQFLTEGERDNSIGYNRHKNFILPNGFDDPGVYKSLFSKNAINALFIGRLDMHHKGLDLLLNVFERNKELLTTKNFHLSIYGPMRYDYYKIAEHIKDKQLQKVVSIIGEVTGKQKEDVLLNSDLFIMTSRLEGHPMGLIEALAYGLPCLVSRGTNMYNEVAEYSCGWVCETKEKSIEEALIKVLEENNTFIAKSLNARKLASCYHWDKIATDFHNILINLKKEI